MVYKKGGGAFMVLRKKGAWHKFTLANRTHLFVHFHVQAVRHLVVLKKRTNELLLTSNEMQSYTLCFDTSIFSPQLPFSVQRFSFVSARNRKEKKKASFFSARGVPSILHELRQFGLFLLSSRENRRERNGGKLAGRFSMQKWSISGGNTPASSFLCCRCKVLLLLLSALIVARFQRGKNHEKRPKREETVNRSALHIRICGFLSFIFLSLNVCSKLQQ